MKARLIIARLDRLARDVHFVSGLQKAKVDFVACHNTNGNKAMTPMMAVVAEMERDLISDRTKRALAALKERGVKLGNPNPEASLKRGRKVSIERANQRAADVLPMIELIRSEGIVTMKGIADELNRRGVTTAKGNLWQATQVKRALVRC